MGQALSLRLLGFALLIAGLRAEVDVPTTGLAVAFPSERIPVQRWAQELIWLKNIGVRSVVAPGADAAFQTLARQAGLALGAPPNALRISALDPDVFVKSRKQMMANPVVIWTDVESEASPEYRHGAVPFSGEEDGSLLTLRREANAWNYWEPVLATGEKQTVANKLPETITVEQKSIPGASAVNVVNHGKQPWNGGVHVALPSYKRTVQIAGITVPPGDGLLLPVDISFTSGNFCRSCSGMGNSERLLYATAELTGIEYENGILSFEFYAPTPAYAVLQLEREPNGPMLAGGRPVAFDWDAENKRAKLPVPAGKGANHRVRIAVTVTAPDHVASFVGTHILITGQTNHIVTDYSSPEFANRSRLIAPAGWKVASEVKSPTQVGYAIDVPGEVLHGDHADLRLEADGLPMSHMRVQLLRPVSVHLAEASALHYGSSIELLSEPAVVAVDGPKGRNLTILLRNNAPEIRNFTVGISALGVEFSPDRTEISLGPSMEREISVRVFAARAEPGAHSGTILIRGAARYDKSFTIVVLPRSDSVCYMADLTGTGAPQTIWENAKIRAVFSKPEGGRWMELYWKESGKNLLPPEGVALVSPVKIALRGDELTIDGASNLPVGGRAGNVEWKPVVDGLTWRYRVTDFH